MRPPGHATLLGVQDKRQAHIQLTTARSLEQAGSSTGCTRTCGAGRTGAAAPEDTGGRGSIGRCCVAMSDNVNGGRGCIGAAGLGRAGLPGLGRAGLLGACNPAGRGTSAASPGRRNPSCCGGTPVRRGPVGPAGACGGCCRGRGPTSTERTATGDWPAGPLPWEMTMFMPPGTPGRALDTAIDGRACWMVKPGAPGEEPA